MRFRRGSLAVVVVVSAVTWTAAQLVERGERRLEIEVTCERDRCRAATRDARVEIPVHPVAEDGGTGVGLYVYHAPELRRRQYVRRLELESASLPGRPLVLGPGDAEGWAARLASSDWTVRAGRGVYHDGRVGERAISMVEGFRAESFRAVLTLDGAVDAGLLLRAVDADHGTVLVARPPNNDLFFFELSGGEPGPIRALAPLRELHAGREALRLGGRVAGLIALGALLVLLSRTLLRAEAPRGSRRERSTPPGVGPGFAAAGLAAFVAVALLGLGGVPHVADEVAYLFQAKIFAGGALSAPPPGEPEFFAHEHLVATPDGWYAKYPPLFPALLSLGVRVGSPWIVNPLLGVVTLLGLMALTRELAGRRWSLVAGALALTSPWFVVTGGSMMSHMACAAAVTWFLVATVRGLRSRRAARWGVVAGLLLGLAVWVRPYTALLVALAAGIYGLVLLCRAHPTARRRAWALGIAGAVVLVPLALGLVVWNDLAGGGYASYDPNDRLGFGPDRGRGWLMTWGSWGHTPAKALRSVDRFLEYAATDLFGWPLALSFAPAAGLLFVRRRHAPHALLLALVFGALVVGHAFYWATQHILFGARYWFSAAPALIVLTTLGLRALVGGEPGRPGFLAGRRAAAAAVLALLVAWNASFYWPRRAAELPAYAGVTADLAREVERRELVRGIVFVRTEGLLYNDGFFMNDPFRRDERLFVRDLGPRNRELMRTRPELPAWRWSGDELVPLNDAALREDRSR